MSWVPSPLNSPPPTRGVQAQLDRDVFSPPLCINTSRIQPQTPATPSEPQDESEITPRSVPIEDLFAETNGDVLAMAEEKAAKVSGAMVPLGKSPFFTLSLTPHLPPALDTHSTTTTTFITDKDSRRHHGRTDGSAGIP